MESSRRTGGCQCGAVRYEIEQPLGRASICHCRMCQKAFGNAFAPLATAPGLRWVRGEPKRFRSSSKVSRGFCGACGTPLTYEPDGSDPEIAIATLDQPAAVAPVIQVGLESRLPWCAALADLPTRTPAEAAKVAPFFADIVSHQHPDRPTDIQQRQEITVLEESIEIPGPDGIIDGYLFHHPERGPRPGIIYLTDIGGIRQATIEMSRRVAERGYCVLLPNAYYRTGKPPLFDFVPNFAEERTRKRFQELGQPLTPDAVTRDAATYVGYLRGRPEVHAGPLAVVGYCFTGAVALRMAAAQPDAIAGVASFHGGWLYADAPTSPHHVLPRVRARLYFAHASNDTTMPQEAIAGLEHALEAWGGDWESETYPDALHGWTVPGSGVYHHEQAERAFEKLMAHLDAALASDG